MVAKQRKQNIDRKQPQGRIHAARCWIWQRFTGKRIPMVRLPNRVHQCPVLHAKQDAGFPVGSSDVRCCTVFSIKKTPKKILKKLHQKEQHALNFLGFFWCGLVFFAFVTAHLPTDKVRSRSMLDECHSMSRVELALRAHQAPVGAALQATVTAVPQCRCRQHSFLMDSPHALCVLQVSVYV
jgi:hypothetical protein